MDLRQTFVNIFIDLSPDQSWCLNFYGMDREHLRCWVVVLMRLEKFDLLPGCLTSPSTYHAPAQLCQPHSLSVPFWTINYMVNYITIVIKYQPVYELLLFIDLLPCRECRGLSIMYN